MKKLIRKILRETFEEKNNLPKTMTYDEALIYFKNRLNDKESKYGEVISNYLKMKMDLDKAKYLLNIRYKLQVNRQPTGIDYYVAQVKFPFGDNNKSPHFKIQIGSKDKIDLLSQSEKEKFIQDKISSYLLNKFPFNYPV
jgi:hypothetical protein